MTEPALKKRRLNNHPDGQTHSESITTNTPSRSRAYTTPTFTELKSDELNLYCEEHWGNDSIQFDKSIVEHVYSEFMSGCSFDVQRIMVLEISHYLEKYLWPYLSQEASFAYVMSVAVMINEKFREGVYALDCFHDDVEKFDIFFDKVVGYFQADSVSLKEKTVLQILFINLFQSIGDDIVRNKCKDLVSLSLWLHISEGRRDKELIKAPTKIKKRVKTLLKRSKKRDSNDNSYLIPFMTREYLSVLSEISKDNETEENIQYCERFLEFCIDLLSQMTTRRYFRTLLDDYHVYILSKNSSLFGMKSGKKFRQLITNMDFYENFEVDDITGQPIDPKQYEKNYYKKITNLQKITFKYFKDELKRLTLSNISALTNSESLRSQLSKLSDGRLTDLTARLNILGTFETEPSREQLLDILCREYEYRQSHIDSANSEPLYPNEDILWDNSLLPQEEFSGEECLALPKLNLQFLTLHDYLLRNYTLYRLESAYEVKHDMEDAIRRVQAELLSNGKVDFRGWARYAVPVNEFHIKYVNEPRIGEIIPDQVHAEIVYYLPERGYNIKEEWNEFKPHDVVFLVSLYPGRKIYNASTNQESFPQTHGIKAIRGCEVIELLDENGDIIDNYEDKTVTKQSGSKRTLRVMMDPAQYKLDTDSTEPEPTFNLLVRRNPKENNFKALLQSVKNIMNSEVQIPDWLKMMMLGYGDPEKVTKVKVPPSINFNDTFLDKEHIIESYPDMKVNFLEDSDFDKFGLSFNEKEKEILVTPYKSTSYSHDLTKRNRVRFTPTQISAIQQSMNHGMSLIVGPPGTGKTDIAVQIISNWYHNYPDQKTLILTHSNQALNQIFEKIVNLDIDEKHLVRLGHGQKSLETDKDFSKTGRVDYSWLIRGYISYLKLNSLQNPWDFQKKLPTAVKQQMHFILLM
eukprot:TRINITY_DN1034_c0_g2_i5.p1 TRINITY_DN1034_c0_g2~~TRINITY_DN1034_c0_g2_i5.p1  ORF type:complete len:917 (-),score=186.52 TRINITY_DN1034_c0_g2_i5:806-3556(-)